MQRITFYVFFCLFALKLCGYTLKYFLELQRNHGASYNALGAPTYTHVYTDGCSCTVEEIRTQRHIT